MKRLAKAFCLCFLCLLCFAPPAQAQFIGFVSPQTTAEQVFDDATGTGCTNVTNVGQSSHVVFYTINFPVGASLRRLELDIQGSYDGTTFRSISDSAKQTGINTGVGTGAVFASGYYPVVRVCINTFIVNAGAPNIDVFYSGTSVSISNRTGIFAQSATNAIVVLDRASPIGLNTVVNPPTGNLGGMLIFSWQTFGTGGNGCAVYVRPMSLLVATNSTGAFRFPVSREMAFTGEAHTFVLPQLAADSVLFTFSCDTSPGGGATANLYYIIGDSVAPSGQFVTFESQDATGTTAALAVSMPMRDFAANVAEANNSPIVTAVNHTIQLNITGAPTSCTYQLEGSLDATSRTIGTWFDISGPLSCTANTLVHIVDRPVRMVRGNLTALGGGAAPTVRLRYLGAQ